MSSDRIMWPTGSKIQFSRNRLDSGRCSPAIESIAGVHIVYFYRFRDVFSCYHIYHFEDFTCILPVRSIAGKHIKNRPHILQCFADFLQNVFGRFSRLSLLGLPTPSPASECGGVPSDDRRKSLALCQLRGLYKIHEKYI